MTIKEQFADRVLAILEAESEWGADELGALAEAVADYKSAKEVSETLTGDGN